jgi:hypothetical protein
LKAALINGGRPVTPALLPSRQVMADLLFIT